MLDKPSSHITERMVLDGVSRVCFSHYFKITSASFHTSNLSGYSLKIPRFMLEGTVVKLLASLTSLAQGLQGLLEHTRGI